ncbi:MAG: alkaline phosphatase family protein [Deltaproteobacteria bacterium]|nr:alkaline phosphatase family protein [Deltaproteobacteria bacterium]
MIAIIGLDGATWDLAGPFCEAGDMPVLADVRRRGAHGVLRSTTPPVTFPAWSSFMTGTNPGKHGIFDFTRRVPGTYEVAFVGSRDRRVPTIWKLLSDAGRRVAVIGVPTTYPPEPVNGIMVGGFDSPVATGIDGSFVHPRELYAEMTRAVGPYAITDFQELTIGPGWHADALPKILAAVDRKRDLARWVLRRERWDCFMMLFGEADTASHHFWMFTDPGSPRFDAEGAPRFRGALREVYRRLDAALGAILTELPSDATVLVASDHGFGGAGTTVLHLNRWLADQGWLAFRAGRRELGARAARVVRRAALALLPRGVQERLVRRGGRALARRLEGWSRFGAIDMARTRAFSEELNYAPSVWLNVRGRDPDGTIAPGAAYDAAVAELRAALLAWRHPETGAAIVARVHRRDELYAGPLVEAAPDLVLELALDRGYSHPCLPTTPDETRSVRRLARREHVAGKGGGMNGSHRPQGLWALAGRGVAATPATEAAIVDVAPSVLHLAGLDVPSWMDGRLLPGIAGTARIADDALVLTEASDDHDHEAELRRRLRALGYLSEPAA